KVGTSGLLATLTAVTFSPSSRAVDIFIDITIVGTGGALGWTVNFSTTDRGGSMARVLSWSQLNNALASGITSTPFAPWSRAYTAGLLQSVPIRPASSVRVMPRGKFDP